MAMLDEIIAYLASSGLGTPAVNLFAVAMPDSPNSLISINQYQGRSPEGDLGVEQPALHTPRLQVKVRAPKPQDAEIKIRAVYVALCGVVNENLGSTRYLSIWPIQEPAYLEDDENSRAVWVCNFEIQKA